MEVVRMVTQSGIYQVSVNPANNPTYLKGGIYHVEVFGKGTRQEANFRAADGLSPAYSGLVEWHNQKGTYERLVMLNIFESQARVICLPVSQSELDALA